jgi:hypothetical protein
MVSPRTTLADVEALVSHAALKNHERDIRGILVFNGHNFMQIIEGPSDHIGALMKRMQTDPRHYNMATQFEEVVTVRCFESWDMRLIVPFNREVPPMPQTLEQPLQRLWGSFCSLG